MSGDSTRVASGRKGWSRGGVERGERAQLHAMEGGHGGQRVLSVSMSGDGTRVASGGADGRVVVWDAASGAQLTRWAGQACRLVSMSGDARG